jgi:hypothetical protein
VPFAGLLHRLLHRYIVIEEYGIYNFYLYVCSTCRLKSIFSTLEYLNLKSIAFYYNYFHCLKILIYFCLEFFPSIRLHFTLSFPHFQSHVELLSFYTPFMNIYFGAFVPYFLHCQYILCVVYVVLLVTIFVNMVSV